MPIVLDLYEGAYGPTLRVDTHVREEILEVAEPFEALASQRLVEVDFSRMIATQAGGLSNLLMFCVPESREKVLSLDSTGPLGASLRWSGSPAYWRECFEKAISLTSRRKPGHQYLTIEGVDDVLVELCNGETQP